MSVSSTSSPSRSASGPVVWFTERVLAGAGAWRFPLLATAVVAAGAAGGQWPGAADAALRLGLAYLLVVCLRLLDDLVDRASDRLRHPERSLVRAASTGPHVAVLCAGLASALVTLHWIAPARAAGLVALLIALGSWYVVPRQRPWVHALALLAKYPALAVLLGTEGAQTLPRVAAMTLLYGALVLHERATDPDLR